MAPKQYACLVVEDDVFVAQQLIDIIIQQDWHKKNDVAHNLATAKKIFSQSTFQLLILDIGLPDGNSITEIAQFKRTQPDCKILILTNYSDENSVISALTNGADGYLLKDANFDLLPSMIHSQLNGGTPMSPEIAGFLLTYIRQQQVQENPLSTKEFQVLKYLAKGLSYDDISELMKNQRSTTATYVRRIFTKMAVTNRSEAVFEANASGWFGLNI